MELLNKEKEALQQLKKELSLRYNLYWLKLVGSKARGDSDKESDIDVVMVLDNVNWDIEKQVYVGFYASLLIGKLILDRYFEKYITLHALYYVAITLMTIVFINSSSPDFIYFQF